MFLRYIGLNTSKIVNATKKSGKLLRMGTPRTESG